MNRKSRILIVDDDSAILFMLGKILTGAGFEVVTATDGVEALRRCRNHHFDLYLVDMIMPRKDGIETILALRGNHEKAPIIAMSGGWCEGTRTCLPLAEKLGACVTLVKPFDRDSLLGAVRDAFHVPQLMAG